MCRSTVNGRAGQAGGCQIHRRGLCFTPLSTLERVPSRVRRLGWSERAGGHAHSRTVTQLHSWKRTQKPRGLRWSRRAGSASCPPGCKSTLMTGGRSSFNGHVELRCVEEYFLQNKRVSVGRGKKNNIRTAPAITLHASSRTFTRPEPSTIDQLVPHS